MPAWTFGYQANCWGPLGGDAVGVTSITRLTYRTFADMATAFREIGEAGYAGVELFDGNLLDYEGRIPEFRRLLDDCGLRLVAAYSGGSLIFPDILDEELARITRAADAIAEAGGPHLVVGGGAKRASGTRPDDYKRLGAALERVARIAEARGLRAHYHPHLTTIVETPEQVDRVLEATTIGLCPDTGHVILGGGDPAQLIARHADRIPYVHLKDVDPSTGTFVPLGQGALDVEGVLAALRDARYDGWITVELDAWDDPLAGAKASRGMLEQQAPA
jgi:inosose dehydratase